MVTHRIQIRTVRRLITCAGLAMLLAPLTVVAQDNAEPKTYLKYLPPTVNTVAAIRVREVMNSPRAKRENWQGLHPTEFLSGALDVTPDSLLVVRGLDFHPEDSRLTQTVGLVVLPRRVDMKKLAQQEGSRVELIQGQSAIRAGSSSYFVELEQGVIGTIAPGYRQNLAYWLRTSKASGGNQPAEFLVNAVNNNSAHFLIAFDMRDMVAPHILRQRLANSSALLADQPAVEQVAKLVEQIRGLTLTANVRDQVEAELRLEFATAPFGKAATFIKPIFLEFLSTVGAQFDDLEQSRERVDGNAVVLNFPLSDSGLRRLVSLVTSPMPDGKEESTAQSSSPANESPDKPYEAPPPSATATVNYFRSVNQLIDDLSIQSRRGKNYLATATWHENFAKKIEQLPLRGVDPEVVDYGMSIANKFRGLAVSLRGVPIEIDRLKSSISYDVKYTPASAGYNVWGWGYYTPPNLDVRTNQAQLNAQMADAIAAEGHKREEVWQMIADDRAKTRVKIKTKYNVDVPPAK